jgi:hypothetical protein
VKRREFLTCVGGAAVLWPHAAGAQQPDRMRRIGILVTTAESDPEGQVRLAAFRRELENLGWADGRDLQARIFWGAGNPDVTTHRLLTLRFRTKSLHRESRPLRARACRGGLNTQEPSQISRRATSWCWRSGTEPRDPCGTNCRSSNRCSTPVPQFGCLIFLRSPDHARRSRIPRAVLSNG